MVAMAKMGVGIWRKRSGSLLVSWSTTFMASTATMAPMMSDPLSPMKMRAGWRLKTRKPSRAPASTKASRLSATSPARMSQMP